MSFKRLSILGVGLLGGSIGLAIKSRTKSCHIIGYGHRAEALDGAKSAGAIDEAFTDLAAAVRGADAVILCTPVGTFPNILQTIAPVLDAGTLVTDVGSTKRSVCILAEKLLPAEVQFVGSHPMAGSEKQGIEAARVDLFQDALCITTPTSKTNKTALARIESFWKELGMHISRLSPDDHDRLLADISHLPHALAAVLIAIQDKQGLPLVGKGFLDSTRIAAGDAGLWRDIFLDNSDNMRQSIRRLKHELDRLDKLLESTESEQLTEWLDQAAQRRKSIQSRSQNLE